jgi:dephospho-CoA kinase
VWREQNQPRGVVVIPLLFETQAGPQFDRVICLACSRSTQQQRLLARGWSPEQIRQRNAAQWSVEEKMNLAHYVAWSEGGIEMLRQQLQGILGRL